MPKQKTKKSTDDWCQKETKRIQQEHKKYVKDLEVKSGKNPKECAVTAMTLAHHGTKEALVSLKKFKKDKRAPDWIDCAIDECEQMLWQDTVGKQLSDAEDKLRAAAEAVFAEKLIWDKKTIINALKAALIDQKIKFSYGQIAKLEYEGKVVGEDKLEFVIDDVLLVGIKPCFADWMIRFKQELEGKDLRKGDLENIEQGMIYDNDGKKLEEPKTLQESFNEFYENQFYNLLEMSKKPEGILLDFSGEQIYGKYFSVPTESGWHTGHCSGWCEGCFEELKCETAQEHKAEEDRKKYRVLKQLLKEIVEIEKNFAASKRPSINLEYQIDTVKNLKEEVEKKLTNEKNKEKIKQIKEELTDWDCEISSLSALLCFEQPKSEDITRLGMLKKMYQKIKQDIDTAEYKKDVEGLEIYYGKAQPKNDDEPGCYHDPLCECDELEPLSLDEEMYNYKNTDKMELADIPF